MSSFAVAVSAISEQKPFQMVLTVIFVLAWLYFGANGLVEMTDKLELVVLPTIGYWFGQVGSGTAVAKRVEKDTEKKVEAQLVSRKGRYD